MFSAILVDKESIFQNIFTFNIFTRTIFNKSTLINTFQMLLVQLLYIYNLLHTDRKVRQTDWQTRQA